jgi:hypothetical protein
MNLGLKIGIGLAVMLVASGISKSLDGNLRDKAMKLCALYLPCFRGDAHFAEICQDFGGLGTTCGYLPGWILFRLGCRDRNLVNRSAAEQGLVYRAGANLSALVQGGKADGIYHSFSEGQMPDRGDILYFGVVSSAGMVSHEHVAICKSFPRGGDGDLVTYDLGHSSQPEGSETTRPMTSDGTVIFIGGQARKLIGFDDITAVPISAPADLSDHTQGIA